MAVLRLLVKTFRLSLMRVGAGWMFALLTFNFNRITIADLGAIAVIITTLIGLHHFISFFQVYWGRLADHHPVFGYRRTPYFLLSSLVASLVFLFLPSIAIGLGQRDPLATLEAFLFIGVFGVAMAMNGSSANALMAEVTTERERGFVVAVIWATIIISGIVSAGVSRAMMPVYSHEAMQQLYNLTPIIVMGTALLGVIGMERRLGKEELAALKNQPVEESTSPLGTLRVARRLMQTNHNVRAFFFFILLGIFGIFLQDAILEPFGAEVFNMPQAQTARFQQYWGAGALLGMVGIGILSTLFSIPKKLIATVGGLGIVAGLLAIAFSAFAHRPEVINPALILMGVSIGLFDVGALALMMDMTIDGQAGMYMGIWGMAQGFGNGFANVLSGAFHTILIELFGMAPALAYGSIFIFEATVMGLAVLVLRGISVQEFKGLSRQDVGTALAVDAAG